MVQLFGGIQLSKFLNNPLDSDKEEAQKPGIYFWVYNGKIWYIGKHENNVWERNVSHCLHQVTGLYSIPNAGYMLKPTNQVERVQNQNQQREHFSNPDRLKSLIEHAFQFRELVTVYWIPKDLIAQEFDEEITKKAKFLTAIESILILELDPADNRRKESIPSDIAQKISTEKMKEFSTKIKSLLDEKLTSIKAA